MAGVFDEARFRGQIGRHTQVFASAWLHSAASIAGTRRSQRSGCCRHCSIASQRGLARCKQERSRAGSRRRRHADSHQRAVGQGGDLAATAALIASEVEQLSSEELWKIKMTG
jgi:hypothetical protein